MTVAFLSDLDGAVALAFAFVALVAILRRSRVDVKLGAIEATVNEVSNAVNGVIPGESKLIDKVRELQGDTAQIKQAQRAQHLATVSVETQVAMLGERVGEVGRKADVASRAAIEANKVAVEANSVALAAVKAQMRHDEDDDA